jgi:hypothetical protein
MADSIGEVVIKLEADMQDVIRQLQSMGEGITQMGNKISGAFAKSQKDADSAIDGIIASLKKLATHPIEFAKDTKGFEEFATNVKEAIENPLGSAGEAAQGFLEMLGPVGTAVGAVGAAFYEAYEKLHEFVDEEARAVIETRNMGLMLNLSYEDTKELSMMASIAGVDIGSLTMGARKLAEALTDPAPSKAKDALKALGITATDSGEALKQVLEKLSEIPDKTERTALAFELLGRGAVRLMPLIENHERLLGAVKRLNAGVDPQALINEFEATKELALAMGELAEGVANFLVNFTPLMTILQRAKDLFVEWGHEIKSVTDALSNLGDVDAEADAKIAVLNKSIEKQMEDLNKVNTLLGMYADLHDRLGISVTGVKDRVTEWTDKYYASLEGMKAKLSELETAHKKLGEMLLPAAPGSKPPSFTEMKEAAEKRPLREAQFADQTKEITDLKAAIKALEDAANETADKFRPFALAVKSFDAAVLVAQMKQAEAEMNKWVNAVAAAGGMAKFAANWARDFAEAAEAVDPVTQAAITADLEHRKEVLQALAATPGAVPAITALQQAFLDIGVSIDGVKDKVSDAVRSFAVIAAQAGSVEALEAGWNAVGSAISTLSKTDLPTAIQMQGEYIAGLKRLHAGTLDILEAEKARIEMEIKLAEQQGTNADTYYRQLDNINVLIQGQIDRTKGLGREVEETLTPIVRNMWQEWARGFATAITEAKNFGQTMMNVLKQIENQILAGLIGVGLKHLEEALGGVLAKMKNVVLQKIGVALGGGDDKAIQATKANTEKLGQHGEKLDKNTEQVKAAGDQIKGASDQIKDQVAPLTDQIGHEVDAIKQDLVPAIDRLIEALDSYRPAGGTGTRPQVGQALAGGGGTGLGAAVGSVIGELPHAAGGAGSLAGAMAKVGAAIPILSNILRLHMFTIQRQREATVQASEALTQDTAATVGNTSSTGLIGSVMSILETATGYNTGATNLNTIALYTSKLIPSAQEGGQVMRTGVALIHAGETVASKNIMQGVGEGLSANATGSGVSNNNINFDGAVFHGVPDRRYVGSIMDSAVRQLRQSSRTWAFDPTGR